jgi:hypothetical protein
VELKIEKFERKRRRKSDLRKSLRSFCFDGSGLSHWGDKDTCIEVQLTLLNAHAHDRERS